MWFFTKKKRIEALESRVRVLEAQVTFLMDLVIGEHDDLADYDNTDFYLPEDEQIVEPTCLSDVLEEQ